jgi:hypothetical protein
MLTWKKSDTSTVEESSQEVLKKGSKTDCTFTIVVYPDNLSPIPSMFSSVKTSENIERDPDVPVPADEGDVQIEYSTKCCIAQI